MCDLQRRFLRALLGVVHTHGDEAAQWWLYDLGVGKMPTSTAASGGARRRRLAPVSLTLLDVQLGKKNDWSQTWGSDKGGAQAAIVLHNTLHARISLFDILFKAEATDVASFTGYFMGQDFSILRGGAEFLAGFGEFAAACFASIHN